MAAVLGLIASGVLFRALWVLHRLAVERETLRLRSLERDWSARYVFAHTMGDHEGEIIAATHLCRLVRQQQEASPWA